MTLKNRLVQLEKQTPRTGRLVVVYEDKTTPEKLAALKNDPTIETLLIVEYVEARRKDSPIEIEPHEVTHEQPKQQS